MVRASIPMLPSASESPSPKLVEPERGQEIPIQEPPLISIESVVQGEVETICGLQLATIVSLSNGVTVNVPASANLVRLEKTNCLDADASCVNYFLVAEY
jgi:hypothetical protein